MYFAFLLACNGASGEPTVTPPKPAAETATATVSARSVDMTQFKNDMNSGTVPVVIDVRTAQEYQDGHVPGAINIPLDQVPNRMHDFDTWNTGEIYLICESGGRSARAATLLSAQGFKTVNIEGGTYAWRNAGYPTEKGAPSPSGAAPTGG